MVSEFELLYSAFQAGFVDGINPCGIATVLIFMIFFSIFGHTPRHIFLLGPLFILVSGSIHAAEVMGFLDVYMAVPLILNYTRIVYLCIAVIFIFLGILNIIDWWRYNSRLDIGCFRLKLPVFLRKNNNNPGTSKFKRVLMGALITLLTLITACLITVLGTTFPKSEYIFTIHSFMMSGGDRGFVYRSFFVYSFAMVLPIIIVWVAVWRLSSMKKRGITEVLYYKGISAALFLSTGIMLGYFFLEQYAI